MYFANWKDGICYKNAGETLTIVPWGENSLRIRSAMMNEPVDTDYALLPPKACQAQITISENHAEIVNGKLRAVLTLDWQKRCEVAFYNQNGKCLLKENGYQGALDTASRHFKPILGGDWELTASFKSDPNEKLYGMGQYQQEIWNIKNCVFELAQRNSQASVPFVLSSAGYGFLWHNPAIGKAIFARNITQWTAASTRQLDYWLTAGDTPDEIERAYADAVGHAPVMPEYGLGFWQCKLRYWNQEQLLNVAREYHRRGIPVSVIVCDYFHWPKLGDYRFDEEFFPDPEAMTAELKEMGIELMVSVWPQVDVKSENYADMQQRGLLIRAERGVQLGKLFAGNSMQYDATNPEARRFVWEKCKENYYNHGIRLFWLDEAEPNYTVDDFDNYRMQLGTHAAIGNIYPQLYAKGFYDGLSEEGEQPLTLVRCAWAGSQRYGALVWSGDVHCTWEAFRSQLCAGLHMAVAGIPWWTTDIGGFNGGTTDDPDFQRLLVRWFEWGTFCPVMRLHGDRMPREFLHHADGSPLFPSGADNEVWSFGGENCETLTRYIHLREAMHPYLRRLMQETHETGRPVMRPMFYEFPQDSTCWDLGDQYMLGSDLLVAPVMYDHVEKRSVYLPAGSQWTLLHTGGTFEGGQTVCVDAPLDTIPVFRRDNALPGLQGIL